MDEDVFDIAIEGTTLANIFASDNKRRFLVIDKSQNYGTTYTNLENLSGSPYIKDFELKFRDSEIKDGNFTFTVESLPFLLSYGDRSVINYSSKMMGGQVEYVKISDIFFISENLYRIPISKNDILKMEISDEDRFYLYQAIKSCDFSTMSKKFTCKSNPIYRALVELKIFEQSDLKRISSFFGQTIFIYPVYGISEICESQCFKNSFNGAVYVLNKTLHYSEINDAKNYSHMFKCNLGTLYSKEFIKQNLIRKKFYIRCILSKKIKYNGNFLAYAELNKNQYTINTNDFEQQEEDKFIKIIGFDSSAQVCDPGLQIIYFIKKYSEIKDSEIELLKIQKNDILIDISFSTIYDINQFN